jgi:hypothetical protein
MHACLKPDNELAVTCVAITANDPKFDRLLDEGAAQAMSAFLVEELMRSTHQDDAHRAPVRRRNEEGTQR